ncbi:MAG: hypothetical protein ABIK68_00210 [bacterium]
MPVIIRAIVQYAIFRVIVRIEKKMDVLKNMVPEIRFETRCRRDPAVKAKTCLLACLADLWKTGRADDEKMDRIDRVTPPEAFG